MNRLALIAVALFVCVACSNDKATPDNTNEKAATESKGSAGETKEAGPLAAASDDQLVDKFRDFMGTVRGDLLHTLDALEKADGDCAKAAAGLMAASTTPKAIEQNGEALVAELRKRSHLESRLEAIKGEFDKSLSSPELKARLQIMNEMGQKCADSAPYNDALRSKGYKKAR